MTLAKNQTLETEMETWTMCASGTSKILLHGKINDKWIIRIIDKEQNAILRDIKCQCDHHSCGNIAILPVSPSHVLECCKVCDMIRMYDLAEREVRVVYTDCKPLWMCSATQDSILILDEKAAVM